MVVVAKSIEFWKVLALSGFGGQSRVEARRHLQSLRSSGGISRARNNKEIDNTTTAMADYKTYLAANILTEDKQVFLGTIVLSLHMC